MHSRLHFGSHAKNGRSTTDAGTLAPPAHQPSEAPSRTARLLQQGGGLIRRHPGVTLAAAFVVGLLLGKVVKR